MDNTFMIGLAHQQNLRRDIDVIANNIANSDTAGFKVERVLTENHAADRAQSDDGPQDLQFARHWGLGRDFSQGQLQLTERALDIGIEGEGFLAVQTPQGERYTRDGRMHLDATGQLVAMDGAPILDAISRAPIFIDETAGDVVIARNGAVTQNGAEVARIGVFGFENRSALEKTGDGRYVAAQGAGEPEALIEPAVVQGFVEASNVQPIMEMTRMITVMRAYSSVSKFLSQAEELSSKAIERLGRSA